MIKQIAKLLLRRPYFRGQYRLFNFLYRRGLLCGNEKIVHPLKGNFKIKCNPKTWVGAQVIYMGEYEAYIKQVFLQHISIGDVVLDIGANIGFHTLFFSNLVGDTGKVIAFEPVNSNFDKLIYNITINNATNIESLCLALGNIEETIYIDTSTNSSNPGAFNLFEHGDTEINCKVGDHIIGNAKVNFIKIDVEGYELFALQGLTKTIKRNRPKIVFEFDKNYQAKAGVETSAIFDFLQLFNYSFYEIKRTEIKAIMPINFQASSADILAIPN